MSAIATAGTTQGTGTLLTGDRWYEITVTDPVTAFAARLPSAASINVGEHIILWNLSITGLATSDASIFPAVGETIDGAAANAAKQLTGGEFVILYRNTSTSWISVKGIQLYTNYLGDKSPIIQFYVSDISSSSDFDVNAAGGSSSTIGNSGTGVTNTIFFGWKTKAANKVLTGPTTGADATPTFRTLVSDDIPNLDAAKITTGTFTTTQIPNLAASKITSGTLAVAQGGTNAATTTANFGFMGPTSGGAAAPSFRALVLDDIPNNSAELSVAAAGTVQGDATALSSTSRIHEVTSGGAGTGVRLPALGAGEVHWIRNKKGSTLNAYPPSGASIDTGAANAALTIPNNQMYPFVYFSTTLIYTTK